MARRIVITGGPGTGKTALVRKLESQGNFCFHEIIRKMTMEATKGKDTDAHIINPLAFVSDPLSFNKKILNGRIRQYYDAENIQAPFVFYDRGIPDVIGYMDFFGQKYDAFFTSPCLNLRYDTVIVLPPWRDIYTRDDERLESFEEASEIHDCLEGSYRKYGYETHSLRTGTVADRTNYLLEMIRGIHD